MNVGIKTKLNNTLNKITYSKLQKKSKGLKNININTGKISNKNDNIKSVNRGVLNYTKDKIETYNYDLEEYMETNLQNISTNVKYIFFCIYKIEKFSGLPYLQYILYKYPNDLMVFPFIEVKNGNILNIIDDYIIDLTGSKQDIKGFFENKNKLHVFVNLNNSTDKINNVSLKTKKHKLWWCLMDEICNRNKVLNFPVHKSVIDIFNNNKYLIYIKNQDNKNISLPNVLYLCDTTPNVVNLIKLNTKPKNKYGIKNSLIFKPLDKILYNGKWLYVYKETYKIIRCSIFLNSKIKTIYNIDYDIRYTSC